LVLDRFPPLLHLHHVTMNIPGATTLCSGTQKLLTMIL
jgi:hypothetical protein